MAYNVEKDWTTDAGFRAVAIRLSDRSINHRCGYVGVPVGHPLHGVGYGAETTALQAPTDDEPAGKRGPIELMLMAVRGAKATPCDTFNVHGSITFADGGGEYPVESDLWWFGFDCGHYGDNEEGGRSLGYVVAECESLAGQIATKTVFTTTAANI